MTGTARRRRVRRLLGAVSAVVVVVGCSSQTTTTGAPAQTGTAGTTGTTGSTAATGTTGTTSTTGREPPSRSTAAGVAAATWGTNVTITNGSTTFTFASNGIPDHAMQAQYPVPVAGVTVPTQPSEATLVANPTTAHALNYSLPLTPTWSSTTTPTPLSTIGVIISGAVLFNPYEANNSTVALDNNFQIDGYYFVDSCNGHPTPPPMGMYHYHGVPTCITATLDTAGAHSKILGFALDGYPITGPQGDRGVAPTDLDACSGHFGPTPEFPEGIYHYHLTTTFPYSLQCFHGVVDPALLAGPPHP